MPTSPPARLDGSVPARSAPPRRGRWVRRIVWTLVLLIAAAGGLYGWATRPARLKGELERLLAQAGFERVEAGDVTFSPIDGLQVLDLRLDLRPPGELRQRLASGQLEPLVQIAQARVACDPWALLAGRFRPREVRLTGVAVTTVTDRETGANNWVLDQLDQSASVRDTDLTLPRVHIEGADVRVCSVENGRVRIARRWILNATGELGRPGAHGGEYIVRVEKEAGAAEAAGRPAQTDVAWIRLRREGFEAGLDWIDFQVLRYFLPPPLAAQLEPCGLSGGALVEQLVVHRGALQAARVRVQDLRGVIPVETEGEARFLKVQHLTGELRLAGGAPGAGADVTLSARGEVNGAPLDVQIALRSQAPGPGSSAAAAFEPFGWRTAFGPLVDVDARLSAAGVEFPDAHRDAAFVSSPHVPAPMRAFIHDYQPRGRTNVMLTARGAARVDGTSFDWSQVAIEGVMEPVGGSCRYFRFPYEITDVGGRLVVTRDGMRVDAMHGRHGGGRIRCDGTVNNSHQFTGFDLTFHAQGIALDADLYAALPEQYRRLWDAVAPLGVCDLVTRVTRAEGSHLPEPLTPEIEVDARLLSASLRGAGGEVLHHADGRIHVAGGVVTIRDLHGYLGDGALRTAGDITLDAAGASAMDLHLEAMDVPVERRVELALPGGEPATVELRGRADVWAQARGANFAGNPGDQYAVRIKDGTLTAPGGAKAWEQVRGWLTIGDAGLGIRALQAQSPAGTLSAAGDVPRGAGGWGSPAVKLDADAADLPRLLADLCPPAWAARVRALGLGGAGKAMVQTRTGTEEGVAVEFSAERAQPEFLPLELRAVSGRGSVAAGGFRIDEVTARYGEGGQIRLSGAGDAGGGIERGELQISAAGVQLCPDFVRAMPGGLARLLARLAPRGAADIELERLSWAPTLDGRAWRFAGAVDVRGADVKVGLPLTECDGRLAGSGAVEANGQAEVSAQLTIARARLSGRPIERWEATVAQRAGERWLHVRDIRGRLCDGELIGFAQLDPETMDYELSVTLRNVDFAALLARPDRKPPQSLREALDSPPPLAAPEGETPGRLDGEVFLRGNASDDASRVGGGELRIAGSSFLRVPALARVVDERRQSGAAVSDALNVANIAFVWEGFTLRLTRVDFQGKDLRLVGEGEWDMLNDQIELTLVGANPRNWPRIAVLSDLVESAGQELVQYRVEGTMSNPRVTAEPLHNLTEPIRKLLKER